MESYILTRTMHLGHLKESFGRGTVIQFDPKTRQLIVDGRRFDDYRDIEVLKRQATKNPENPWIIKYSDEAIQEIRQGADEAAPAVPKREPNGADMEVVRSDADDHETIDISQTKVSARKREEKEAERTKASTEDLPVVTGQESVEDRIARLKKKPATDMAARAERVRLMRERKAEMPVERDDSLGHSGSAAEALNAGVPVGGRRTDEDTQALDIAKQRKADAERRRQIVMQQEGVDADQAGIDEVTPSPVSPPADDKEARIAKLKAELAELEGDAKSQSAEESPRKTQKIPVTD